MIQTTPRKIIIDTDPGQDDAVAILMALASPDELDILGITVVAGNVPLRLTQDNARKICELVGRYDVDIHAGAAAPLKRPLVTAENVHGKTGLDGIDLPQPKIAIKSDCAVDFIIEKITSMPEKTVTLCCLGPLTNIALALIKAPHITPRIEEIVLMGGAFFEGGNITPAAEFNFYVDPEAADIVLRSGAPITMLPLDVTHKALVTPPRLGKIRALKTRASKAVADWISFSERFDKEKYRSDGAPLHDPCVTGYLLRPELFIGRKVNVLVSLQDPLTFGMSVVDWWAVTERAPNVTYMRDIDADGFFALLTAKISAL